MQQLLRDTHTHTKEKGWERGGKVVHRTPVSHFLLSSLLAVFCLQLLNADRVFASERTPRMRSTNRPVEAREKEKKEGEVVGSTTWCSKKTVLAESLSAAHSTKVKQKRGKARRAEQVTNGTEKGKKGEERYVRKVPRNCNLRRAHTLTSTHTHTQTHTSYSGLYLYSISCDRGGIEVEVVSREQTVKRGRRKRRRFGTHSVKTDERLT